MVGSKDSGLFSCVQFIDPYCPKHSDTVTGSFELNSPLPLRVLVYHLFFTSKSSSNLVERPRCPVSLSEKKTGENVLDNKVSSLCETATPVRGMRFWAESATQIWLSLFRSVAGRRGQGRGPSFTFTRAFTCRELDKPSPSRRWYCTHHITGHEEQAVSIPSIA